MTLAACLPGLGRARAAQAPPAQPKVLVLWESGAPGDLLADPKDAGLRRALSMIPGRLDRLRTEVKGFQAVPPQAVGLLLTLLSSPVRLSVVDRGPDPQSGAPGIGVFLSLGMAGQDAATAMHRNALSLLALAGAAGQTHDSPANPGMTEMQTPIGALAFGPHGDAGAWTYDVLLGRADDAKAALATLPAFTVPAHPWARGRLDLAAFTPLAEMLAAQQPTVAPVLDGLRASGLIGPDAVSFDVAVGEEDGWLGAVSVARGMWKFHEANGLVRAAITDGDLSAVPADATTCSIAKRDLGAVWRWIDNVVTTAGAQDELAEFTRATGVDPAADIFGALGDSVVLYLSDSTGGGGLLSAVGGVSLSDRARLLGAIEKLAAAGNAIASRPDTAKGYVQIKRWADDGVEYVGVRFPGLPIPLEPTIALTEKWALVGATRDAATAAVLQATGKGDGGLAANAAYRVARAGMPKEAVSVVFLDSARCMRDSYGVASLVGAALANAVRSPTDDAGDPGLILPRYNDLRAGARPALTIMAWDGDDLVTRCRTDRSMIVSMTGAAGAFTPLATTALFAGVLLPALGSARNNARLLQDGVQLRQIHAAACQYAAGHADRFPPSTDPLVEGGLVDADLLTSPFEPVGDGGGDYFLKPNARNDFVADEVVAYSRSGFMHGELVNVVYGDGRVVAMKKDAFRALLSEPKQQGVDWRLPGAARKRAQPRP